MSNCSSFNGLESPRTCLSVPWPSILPTRLRQTSMNASGTPAAATRTAWTQKAATTARVGRATCRQAAANAQVREPLPPIPLLPRPLSLSLPLPLPSFPSLIFTASSTLPPPSSHLSPSLPIPLPSSLHLPCLLTPPTPFLFPPPSSSPTRLQCKNWQDEIIGAPAGLCYWIVQFLQHVLLMFMVLCSWPPSRLGTGRGPSPVQCSSSPSSPSPLLPAFPHHPTTGFIVSC